VSATGVSVDVAREVRAICGEENVRERPIGGVYVSPASAEEVAAVLALANERQLTVGPAGGSTERSAAELHVDLLLHLNRLTGVEHYDHADLTVGVGAGTTIAQLSAMVNADNLMFASDPALPGRCTIGGLLATAAHGPLRHGYGGVRDFCIGVRFVTGDGKRAKGGGRVVKNVAGYDLMKLLIGSYGTLAVITSASFKLFPAPRQTRTFLAEFRTANEALQFRDRVVGSPLSPMCLELVSPGARKLMRPEMTEDAWVMCLRAAGSDIVLARYHKELGSAITTELEGDDETKMWRAIADFPVTGNLNRAIERAPEMIGAAPRFNVTVPLNEVAEVISVIDEFPKVMSDSSGGGLFGIGMVGRVGVGHILTTAWPESFGMGLDSDTFSNFLVKRLPRQSNLTVAGSVNPWPIAPPHFASMRAVKQALDPKNILRGREMF